MLAINALYRLPRGELLLQDAPELIEKVCTRAANHTSSRRSSITLGSCCVIPMKHFRGNLNPPYAPKIEMAVQVATPLPRSLLGWASTSGGCCSWFSSSCFTSPDSWTQWLSARQALRHSHICTDQNITPHFMAQF